MLTCRPGRDNAGGAQTGEIPAPAAPTSWIEHLFTRLGHGGVSPTLTQRSLSFLMVNATPREPPAPLELVRSA